jgi:hypothetical protein
VGFSANLFDSPEGFAILTALLRGAADGDGVDGDGVNP